MHKSGARASLYVSAYYLLYERENHNENNIMNKLVIGCGYLGRRVAQLWQQQGHTVFATTRNNRTAEEFRNRGLQPIICDVMNRVNLSVLPKVDTVLYAVGLDRSSGYSMRDVYVQGLTNVLEHLPTPEKFLHISSTSVYAQTDGQEVEESAETAPTEANGQVVLAAEQVLHSTIPTAMILRFAGIYGPDRWLRRKTIESGEAFVSDRDKWLNLIHVDDGARIVLAAEEHYQPGEVLNVSDDLPVKRADFYGFMAELLKAELRMTSPPENETGPNRRISNHKMYEKLGVKLQYPTYAEGLTASQE